MALDLSALSLLKSETAQAPDKRQAQVYVNISFPATLSDGTTVEIPVPLGIPLDFIEVNSKTYVGSYSGDSRKQMQSAVKTLIAKLQQAGAKLDAGASMELGVVKASLQRRGTTQEVEAAPNEIQFDF